MAHELSGTVTFACPDCRTPLEVDVATLEGDPQCVGCGRTLELQAELDAVWELSQSFDGLNDALQGGPNAAELDGLCRRAAGHIRNGATDQEVESALITDGCDAERARKVAGGMRGLKSDFHRLKARSQVVRGMGACALGAAIIGVAVFVTDGIGPRGFAAASIFYGVVSLVAAAVNARKGGRGDSQMLAELGVNPRTIASLVTELFIVPEEREQESRQLDREPGAASFCRRCGAQFQASMGVCPDCKVVLTPFGGN